MWNQTWTVVISSLRCVTVSKIFFLNLTHSGFDLFYTSCNLKTVKRLLFLKFLLCYKVFREQTSYRIFPDDVWVNQDIEASHCTMIFQRSQVKGPVQYIQIYLECFIMQKSRRSHHLMQRCLRWCCFFSFFLPMLLINLWFMSL